MASQRRIGFTKFYHDPAQRGTQRSRRVFMNNANDPGECVPHKRQHFLIRPSPIRWPMVWMKIPPDECCGSQASDKPCNHAPQKISVASAAPDIPFGRYKSIEELRWSICSVAGDCIRFMWWSEPVAGCPAKIG